MATDPLSMIVAYVDDIHILLSNSASLRRILGILLEYSSDFRIDLSREKSALWGREKSGLQEVSRECGIPWSASLHTLGAEWPSHSNMLRKWRGLGKQSVDLRELSTCLLSLLQRLMSSLWCSKSC